ncbi:MAG TPA: enoyl-CoA hydratase/isomerase family protein [Bordetella sp.]|nr:enoyl-CoA hydratase/isomerase family protein [Bordetella sp.]
MNHNTDGAPTLDIQGPLARLRLSRPSQHNRLDPSDLPVMLEHLERVAGHPGLRVLVLSGTGRQTFSSGYTLAAIRNELDDRFERVLDTLEQLPLPVICALNGSVYGGATDLALCCDIRIGVRGSRLFMPAAKFGLHYYPGGLRRYVANLGLPAAKKLFLTARAIYAEEMLRIGFLTELVEATELDATVESHVQSLLDCEPGVVASMKAALNQIAAGTADAAQLRAAYEASLRSEELARRVG